MSHDYTPTIPTMMGILTSYLSGYGNVRLDGNDILLDDRKVASWASMDHDGYITRVMHISVGMDEDLVNEICTKPMVKRPGRLADYAITSNDILSAIEPVIRSIS